KLQNKLTLVSPVIVLDDRRIRPCGECSCGAVELHGGGLWDVCWPISCSSDADAWASSSCLSRRGFRRSTAAERRAFRLLTAVQRRGFRLPTVDEARRPTRRRSARQAMTPASATRV